MTIRVLYFASLREQAGHAEQALELDAPTSVRELARRLEAERAGLRLSGVLCAVNEEYAEPERQLQDGDTVAFFPPVSGGA